MAIFIPNITVETVNKCNDLKITDNSIFTEETPKILYSTRTITITKTDGTEQIINFPIGGINPDIITLTNYLKGLDYYISIKIVYSGEIEEQYIVTWNGNHISTCNAEVGRSKFMNKIDCSCGCEHNKCDISNLSKLDTTIENSIRAATYGLGVKAQTFLDASLDIIKVLESDCNC
jgi:hypothetical protein